VTRSVVGVVVVLVVCLVVAVAAAANYHAKLQSANDRINELGNGPEPHVAVDTLPIRVCQAAVRKDSHFMKGAAHFQQQLINGGRLVADLRRVWAPPSRHDRLADGLGCVLPEMTLVFALLGLGASGARAVGMDSRVCPSRHVWANVGDVVTHFAAVQAIRSNGLRCRGS
jgi:hypothetical protein